MRHAIIATLFITAAARADDWPQYLGSQRDGVWRETGILDKFPAKPSYRWRTPVGQGYAGPAVADGRVFVTDLVLGDGSALPKSGFSKNSVGGKERVLCLDEKTGKEIWKHEYPVTYQISYPAGPRCTPTVDGDRVYTLGAMGDLFCLNVKDGKVLWKKNFMKNYDAEVPVWGFSSHPLIHKDLLICIAGGSDGRGVIAFEKNTGEQKWASVTTRGDFGYGVPVVYDFGGKPTLVIWHSTAVVGLEPDTGKRLWSEPWEIRASLTAPMPRQVEKDKLFLTSFYNGSMLLKIENNKASIVWKSKSKGNQDAVNPDKTVDLHSIMPTPLIKDGYIYGVCSYGELRCLKLDTGERVWATYEPITGKSVRWGNAFIVSQGDRYFLFNELGDLIIAKLTPEKYEEASRMNILAPTNGLAGRPVVWTHPAFANKSCYARNDKEIVRVSLEK